MQLLAFFLLVFGSLTLTLFSYLTRLHTERGRFMIHGSKDNVEFYDEHVAPKLGMEMEQAAWAFPFLVQANVVFLGMIIAVWNLGKPIEWLTVVDEVVLLLLDVLVFGLVIPNILLSRTRGQWLRAWTGPLLFSAKIVYPLVAIGQFLHRIAMLGAPAEEEEQAPATASENIEALMQAGEEEGLLEKEDRRLIQSVMEFGDTTVREVMTPRQDIFAVPGSTTVGELKQMLATQRYTRVPVYEGDLDHTIGFIHSGDLFAIEEEEGESRTVRELLHPIPFVPETKRISELLQELQQKSQIAMVVDEYGSVAGLVTVEDLVEEIVGEIHDEHEPTEVTQLPDGRFDIPGSLDIYRLQELLGVHLQETGEARTVSGFVMDALGHVPTVGETLQRDGVDFQVTEANGRRVVRMLVGTTAPESGALFENTDEEEPGGTARGPSKPAA